MKMHLVPILFFTFATAFFVNSTACPPEEDTYPCHIRTFHKDLLCKGLQNPDDILWPVQAAAKCETPLTELRIEDSSLMYIPRWTFNNTKFERIYFYDTDIMSLSDTDVAFQGLENHLESITGMKNLKNVTRWSVHWRKLANLKRLTTFETYGVRIGDITEPFPALESLEYLSITDSNTSFIADNAFYALKNLHTLILYRNSISELKRNMLPEPAKDLEYVDLSENKVENLPADFFTNMPSLQHVDLSGNRFTAFDSQVFSWVLKNVDYLNMSGNEFRCDCHLRWIVDARYPDGFEYATCNSPQELAGEALMDVKIHHLSCENIHYTGRRSYK